MQLKFQQFVFIAAAFILFAFPVQAKAEKPITINMNNPKYRKLVMAVAPFEIDSDVEKSYPWVKGAGSKQLDMLLKMTNIFDVKSPGVFGDLLKAHSFATSIEPGSFDFKSWRTVGIEGLVRGKLSKEKSRLVIDLYTVDISGTKRILAKRFSVAPNKSKFIEAIRTYADRIMQHYTGKSGVFNSKIVFIGRKKKKSTKQVYVCDIDGSNVIQITRDSKPHVSPSWSPDGKKVVYTSYVDGNPDLFTYDLETGKRRKLAGGKGLNSGGNWAANGKLLAYTGSFSGDTDIFTVNPQGKNRRLLIRGEGLDVDPVFSPDGQWLLFVSGRYGNPHIFRARLEWKSDSQVIVTGDKRLTYAGWYNATPDWAPDSNKIAFAGYDKDIDRFDLFTMKPDGTNLERLTIRSGDNESPSWSPNGLLLVFQSNRVGKQDKKGVAQLYIMNADGSYQTKIDTGLYEAQTPDWGPNLR